MHPQVTIVVLHRGEVASVMPFSQPLIRIGRAREVKDGVNDIVLNAPRVSTKHAHILVAEAGLTVVDHSTNGTFVNGEPITAPRALAPGDQIEIDGYTLRWELGGADAPPPEARRPAVASPPASTLALVPGDDELPSLDTASPPDLPAPRPEASPAAPRFVPAPGPQLAASGAAVGRGDDLALAHRELVPRADPVDLGGRGGDHPWDPPAEPVNRGDGRQVVPQAEPVGTAAVRGDRLSQVYGQLAAQFGATAGDRPPRLSAADIPRVTEHARQAVQGLALPAGLWPEWLARELCGLGPLGPLLDDPAVTRIVVRGADGIDVHRGNHREACTSRFSCAQALLAALERWTGRHLDDSFAVAVEPGLEVHAWGPAIALSGPLVTISRTRAAAPLGLEDLVAARTLPGAAAEMLRLALRRDLNILVHGGPAADPSRLLAGLAGSCPPRPARPSCAGEPPGPRAMSSSSTATTPPPGRARGASSPTG
ncbi:FHA domain-containing protein [Nannocystis pusilla]|uniref:FHA domain-containing protein n=1 Tax=Nannocystis pusilla TaxID=889268 RepID=A0A9X3F0L8_9BACT|nr:FHA domain-containing protein [Nannocystis pusilla]MCY1013070.1 FHA domain-containing protein [Nannocystis pusilla]